jgi:filamentous hemagglutinin family protein
MTQLCKLNQLSLSLSLITSACIISCLSNTAFCEELKADKTLGADSSIVLPGSSSNNIVIAGGAQRGTNLFHSFENFNINNGQSVYFNNPIGIDRIISRVIGASSSKIDGVLGVLGGADLFLLNPNGITFGSSGSLNLKGSFLATTATRYIFNDSEFSTVGKALSNPLSNYLPIGLQFRNTSGLINNKSNVYNSSGSRQVGLEVQPKNFLSLVGGDVILDGGILTAPGGRIEIGSIIGSNQVKLDAVTGLIEYEGISAQNFGDINLKNGAVIVSRSTIGGNISLRGKSITLADQSMIGNVVRGSSSGGKLTIVASDTFTLKGLSALVTSSFDNADSGDVIINSNKVFLLENSYIQASSTYRNPAPGVFVVPTGSSGDVKIEATQIDISGGSQIKASTIGDGDGGNIEISSSGHVNIFGNGSGLFSSTQPFQNTFGSGGAGNIKITAKSLNITDGAEVDVSSFSKGSAGNINIFARSILLENDALISSKTSGGEGNIFIHQAQDIVLRNNSMISANAADASSGGNINIDTSLLIALPPIGSNGSDIVAIADKGRGGNITITAQGIFGIQQRKSTSGNQTNDIDASSQFGQSGQVQINTTTDPNQGLVELPATVIDPTTLVAQNPCRHVSSSEFTRSGRGGLPPSLSQDLSSETTQVSATKPELTTASKSTASPPLSSSQIAPAQGWVYNEKGEVVLVAYNSAITGPQRLQSNPKGCPVL